MSRSVAALLTLLFLVLPAAAAVHPNTASGTNSTQAFASGEIDNVNLFNGSLTMTVPIGPAYPLNGGFSYRLQLVYNSSPWVFETVSRFVPELNDFRDFTSAYANPCANAGMGWRLSFGRINPTCQIADSNTPGFTVYQDEMGSDHVFYSTLHEGETSTPGVQYSRDGSYLRLVALGSTSRLEQPDGSYRIFDANGMPTEIRDALGNGFSISYAVPKQWVITDSAQRVHTIKFRMDLPEYPQGSIEEIDLAAFGGTTAIYGFGYESHETGRPCPHNDNIYMGARGSTDVVPFLVGVNLPDGTAYYTAVAKNYLVTPTLGADCTLNAGNILKFTVPTGAEYNYTWQTYFFPTGSATKRHQQQNPGVATRQLVDPIGGTTGTWSYQTQTGGLFPTGPELKNLLIDPLGNKRESYFSIALDGAPGAPNGFGPGDNFDYSLPFTRQTTTDGGTLFLTSRLFQNNGSPAAPSYSATPTRSEYVAWERDPFGSFPGAVHSYNTNRRPFRSRTVFHDDGGSYSESVSSDFDGLGHYRRQDFKGSGFPGISNPNAVLRTETRQYNPARGTYTVNLATHSSGGTFTMLPSNSPWVLETMSFSQSEEGGQVAKTELCYHSNTTRVIRTRVLRSGTGTQTNNDLVTVTDLNEAPAGQPAMIRGNAAHEMSYGGDGAGQAVLATGGANLCTLALPAPEYQVDSTFSFGVRDTSKYDGFNAKTLDQTIDANTGLTASSRDAAGIQTDFEYDKMGRPTWSKPALGHGSWTEFVYTVRLPFHSEKPGVIVRSRDNGSKAAAILSVSQQEFDGLGRLYREYKSMPGGVTTKRESLYDTAGHAASVSTWFTAANPTTKTQFQSYDAFGRARQIVPPDGAAHAINVTYTGARQVDRSVPIATSTSSETSSTTTEIYDRFGRLVQVSEPSGTSGAVVTTSYGYEVGNRLISVSTPVAGSPQSRTFTYDRAGLLLNESHPEKGTTGNGTVFYPKYDSRGHLIRKQDGASDLTYAYDKAERLTQVRESLGSARTLKSFSWSDAATGLVSPPGGGASCTNYTRGKLVGQSRFNYVTVGGGPFKVEIREGMTYCGRDGRLSHQTLENRVNDSAQPNESFLWPSWAYDALGNVTTFGYPQCSHAACTALSPRTLLNSYSEGLLSQVGIPGAPGRYANSITYHPSGMVNQVVHANTPSSSGTWVSDTYALDANGLSRPASIQAAKGATTLWSTGAYAFDGAGNIKSIATLPFVYDKVSRLTQANFRLESIPPANPATGQTRNQGFSYDPYGNLLSMSGSVARTIPINSGTNRLASPSAYDAQGNITGWNGSQYEYDPFNQMWHYKTATAGDEWIYLYTADDERVWSYRPSANTSLWTLRDQDDSVVREYTNNGIWALQSDLIHRGGQLLAAETSAGLRHFHLDHLGTPRLVTDLNGNQTAYHVYYPYGEEATPFNQDTIRERFTGHERDLANPAGASDDLDYMHARFYSPVMGRFWSVDPTLESVDPRSPHSWGRFDYVRNNPVNATDPTGEILFFLGSRTNLSRIRKIANDNLQGYDLVIGKNGNASLVKNNEVGPASAGQTAFADALRFAIDRGQSVAIEVKSGSSKVMIGSFDSGRIDIQDIERMGAGPGASAAGGIAHEVVEQTIKQIYSLSGIEDYGKLAHNIALSFQAGVTGYRQTSANHDDINVRTLTGSSVSHLSKGRERLTVTFHWFYGDLISVDRH